MDGVADYNWFRSISGIVIGTGVAVELLKRFMGRVQPALFDQLPTWLWSVLVAALLTTGSKLMGWLGDSGTWMELIMQTVILAAMAGGFQSWWDAGFKPIADSSAAIRARKSLLVLVMLIPSLMLGGCALREGARHNAVVADTVIYNGLAAFQDTENLLFTQKRLTAAQHKEINTYLVPALKTAYSFNRTVRSWPANQPAPAEVRQIADNLKGLVEQAIASLPDGPTKDRLLVTLSPVQTAVLALLSAFLPPPQAGVFYGPESGDGMGATGWSVVPDWSRGLVVHS